MVTLKWAARASADYVISFAQNEVIHRGWRALLQITSGAAPCI
jgi:hypothetical protein